MRMRSSSGKERPNFLALRRAVAGEMAMSPRNRDEVASGEWRGAEGGSAQSQGPRSRAGLWRNRRAEGEDVGGALLFAIGAIQARDFCVGDEGDGDFGFAEA